MADQTRGREDPKAVVPLLNKEAGGKGIAVSINTENKANASIGTKIADDPHGTGVRHPTTYCETLFHLIKGNIGSGIFAMGDAFKNSGLLLGPVLTITLGVICVYGNHMLIRCSKELGQRKKMAQYPTFPDTMEWAFQSGPEPFRKHSKTIRLLVKIFNVIAQLGFCSVYFLMISSTLQRILGKYEISLDVHVWMVIIFIPMVSTAMIRNLKYLVPFSVLANFLIIASVILTTSISMVDLPPISSRPAIADLSRIPLFFGTAIYCFEGISLVLPLQSEMKQPDRFGGLTGVLNVGMTIAGLLLLSLGFVGYLKYGDDVKGSLTLNLPEDQIISELVQLAISIGLFFTYALQLHIGLTYVWPDFSRKYGPFKHPVLVEMGMRLTMAMTTFIAAEVVPRLGLFISLLGSVSSTALALVFPPMCDLALHWGHTPGPNYVFDTLSLIVALIGFSTGSYFSLRDIIRAFFE